MIESGSAEGDVGGVKRHVEGGVEVDPTLFNQGLCPPMVAEKVLLADEFVAVDLAGNDPGWEIRCTQQRGSSTL